MTLVFCRGAASVLALWCVLGASLAAQAEVPEAKARAEAIAAKRVQLRKQLLRLLASGSRDRPKLLLRLSDNYLGEARDAEQQAWDEAQDADYARQVAETARSEALALLNQLIEEFPHFSRWDEAVYLRGSVQDGLGDKAAAANSWRLLVGKRPRSSWAPSAWLALGEHFFSNNEVGLASTSSASVTRGSRGPAATRSALFTVSLIVAVPSSARALLSASSSRSTRCLLIQRVYIMLCSYI